MKGKYSYLKGVAAQDEIMLDKVEDYMYIAKEKYIVKYSFFLDERQADLCKRFLEWNKYGNFAFWGGYDNAKRKVLSVYPEYEIVNNDDFPIAGIIFKYRKEDRLSHRDFLGALMSLGIKRECVGDILVGEGRSSVCLTESAAHEVLTTISKIGRVGVKVSEGFDESIEVKENFTEISGSVASLRCDSVLSLAAKISREKSAELIRNVGIIINYIGCNSPGECMKQGDVFSVKGLGKFVLKSVNGETKKGRLHITVYRYV